MPINEILKIMMKEDKELEVKAFYASDKCTCYTGNTIEGEHFFPAWSYDEDDYFVQKAYKGLKEAGMDPKITYYSFCTNGSHYAGEAKIKTIGFGPSYEYLAHIINEYIEVEDLYKGVKGYYGILKEVFGK